MQNHTINSIFNRFAYLSADVRPPITADHPNNLFEANNKFDPENAEEFARQFDLLAKVWGASDSIEQDLDFNRAVVGLRTVLNAVSATSLMIVHCGELVVERPGTEVENRRKEISALCDDAENNWQKLPQNERNSFAKLALIGLAPLQVEVVNYLDTNEIPNVLGKMLSRLDIQSQSDFCKNLGAKESLSAFFDIEAQVLEGADLVRIGIPMGTRPRVYAPKETLEIDIDTFESAKSALGRNKNFDRAVSEFFGLIWRDFADEGFFIIHEGSEVNAYALVGGCCYHYNAQVDYDVSPATVTQANPLRYISTVGEFVDTPWRRNGEKLCFSNATEALTDFRKSVMNLEALPESDRAEVGESGYLKKAASRLLNRQINYNISHVINGQMERISSVEWSPNMCRDQFGAIYNPPHALGGVGEMFRTLLDFGDRSSQFRTWRELDGTHGLSDIKKFLGYSRALDKFLISNKFDLKPTNSPSPM